MSVDNGIRSTPRSSADISSTPSARRSFDFSRRHQRTRRGDGWWTSENVRTAPLAIFRLMCSDQRHRLLVVRFAEGNMLRWLPRL